MSDFRTDPMPSVEGQGNAQSGWRRAWDAYSSTVNRAARPAAEPAARWIATRTTEDMVGFWLIWHLEGGFEGLQRLGMSRSAIYRRISRFRKLFGEHPDVYRFPGVTVDVEAYLRGTEDPPADS